MGSNCGDDCAEARITNDSIESLILASMVFASLWVYYSIYKLDVNPNPISFLDDLLLIICLPSFFIFGLLNCVSGVGGKDLESTVPTNIFMVRNEVVLKLRSTNDQIS